jgi:hypothetical protein
MRFEEVAGATAAGRDAAIEGIENYADRVARAEKILDDFSKLIQEDPSILDRPGVRSIIEGAEHILEEAGEEPTSRFVH